MKPTFRSDLFQRWAASIAGSQIMRATTTNPKWCWIMRDIQHVSCDQSTLLVCKNVSWSLHYLDKTNENTRERLILKVFSPDGFDHDLPGDSFWKSSGRDWKRDSEQKHTRIERLLSLSSLGVTVSVYTKDLSDHWRAKVLPFDFLLDLLLVLRWVNWISSTV